MMPHQFKRLLLIDDEPAIRRMMSLDLGSDGYEVYTAEDGASGLEEFAKRRPHIVLTDLKMPNMDGIEVLRRIKEISPETEVIVITGHGDLELAIQALQLRASDFLTKPINGAALDVALMRAAERLALTRELASYTKDLEQKVTLATRKVLAAERLAAVGRTVAGLVHSLRNMLSGLRGGAYLVEQHRETKNQQQLDDGLEMLNRNLGRVKALVNNLLMVSKPRIPEIAAADAGELLGEAVQCASQQAESKSVALEFETPHSQALVMVDRKMILDALGNLVGNAIDAAAQVPQGQVRAYLETRPDETVFVIQDNGPGLDEQAKEHLFEAFYSSKGAQGTGLGLMVAQKIAQEHGGRVAYQPADGRGSVFRLTLPKPKNGDEAGK